MKQFKTKMIAMALGTAVLLGAGVHARAEGTMSPSGSKEKSSGSVGQYVDDATITARVKSKFATDETVSAMRISVDTVKGIVELSGNVASEAELEKAIVLARAVPDVRGVRNNMTIKAEPKGTTSSKPSRTPSSS